MVETTLGSLMGLAGLVWIGTQFLKSLLKQAPQNLIALVLGQAATLSFWQAGVVSLDGADPTTWTGWAVASIYGLVAVASSAHAHELAQNPKKLVKRVSRGKV